MSANFAQIRLGSDDEVSVRQLQTLLNKNGANLQVDGIFGAKTEAAVRQYQQANGLKADGVVGVNTWSVLLRGTPTATVPMTVEDTKKAWENHVAQKPGMFFFEEQDRLDAAKQAVENRETFSYNPDADALYRYYRNSYTDQGRRAMEDTVGVVSARTGGYGSSYAQTVGQQAYQDYLGKLGEVGQDLYKLAYEKYADETDRLQDEYAAWEKQRAAAYGDYQDEIKDYEAMERQLYARYKDALARRDKNFTQLSKLLKDGYIPTDEELEAAGMTRVMSWYIAEN